jgi:hypothetical protein
VGRVAAKAVGAMPQAFDVELLENASQGRRRTKDALGVGKYPLLMSYVLPLTRDMPLLC